jgi:hypothetical protein
MTVIHGKVWPDHEFPQETFGYHADRNSVHDFGTPLRGRKQTMRDIERLKTDEQTYRLRVARYKLVEVEEIEVVGERPNLPTAD